MRVGDTYYRCVVCTRCIAPHQPSKPEDDGCFCVCVVEVQFGFTKNLY